MEWLTDPQIWIALLTLATLEIVLGIDNIVFISILAARLPASQQKKARRLGLLLAMVTRIALLFSLSWVIGLTEPLFNILGEDISGRDLILVAGGLFLLAKSTHELHARLEAPPAEKKAVVHPTFGSVLVQIALLDIVFSLDSVITAVGMVEHVEIMIAAVVIAVAVMILFAEPVSHFVEAHPTVKVLALSFLLLIGMSLIAEGLDHHIPKGYIYFAMGFSIFVEMINLRVRKKQSDPVTLHSMARTGEHPVG